MVSSFPIHGYLLSNVWLFDIVVCVCVCEQTCMQYAVYCDYDLSLLLQMALDKVKPDEIVRRDIETVNVRASSTDQA